MRPFELIPSIKDYIWGGTRLREEYGKVSALDRLAAAALVSGAAAAGGLVVAGRRNRQARLRDHSS